MTGSRAVGAGWTITPDTEGVVGVVATWDTPELLSLLLTIVPDVVGAGAASSGLGWVGRMCCE